MTSAAKPMTLGEQARVAREWWRTMISDADGERATRARLRRCSDAVDAMAEPAALLLARRLDCIPVSEAQWQTVRFERALILSVVLAHVREEADAPLLRQLGWKTFPGPKQKESEAGEARPVLSEIRFRRLLQIEPDGLIEAFRRLLNLAGQCTDVAALARCILGWDDDRTRQRLAVEYFNARSDRLAAAGQGEAP